MAKTRPWIATTKNGKWEMQTLKWNEKAKEK